MAEPKLEIITGDVLNVQLTTETHVRGGQGGGKRSRGLEVSTTVVNRMRLFLRGTDGKERDFTFANCTVGVRDGHTVSIVRARRGRSGAPLTIMLRNHSTGQQEEFAQGLNALFATRTLAAHWRALAGGAVVAGIVWAGTALLTMQPSPLGAGLAAGVFGFLALWAVFWIVDQFTRAAGARERLARLRAEIETRTRPFDRIEG